MSTFLVMFVQSIGSLTILRYRISFNRRTNRKGFTACCQKPSISVCFHRVCPVVVARTDLQLTRHALLIRRRSLVRHPALMPTRETFRVSPDAPAHLAITRQAKR